MKIGFFYSSSVSILAYYFLHSIYSIIGPRGPREGNDQARYLVLSVKNQQAYGQYQQDALCLKYRKQVNMKWFTRYRRLRFSILFYFPCH